MHNQPTTATIEKAPIKAILTLCFVILIDSIGLGLLFPLLNPVFMSNQGILPVGTSLWLRDFYYGLTLALFTIGMFFAAPILGDLSDQVGRRKVLIFILLGTGIAYALGGLGIMYKSVLLLLISRFIAGFAAGSQTIAQAAVIDICPPHKKTSYLSFVFFFVSLGFMLGPLIGGFSSDANLVSWFGLATPLYISAILSLLNLLMLWFYFGETLQQRARPQISWSKAVTLFLDAFKTPAIRQLAIVFFFVELAWSYYYQFVSILMSAHYRYDTNKVGIFMAVMALGFGTTFLIIIPRLTHYMKIKHMHLAGLIVFLTGLALTAFIPDVTVAWVATLLVAVGQACYYTTCATLCSDLVGQDKQGWVMGVLTSVVALCLTITALSSSLILSLGVFGPFIAAAFSAALGLILLLAAKK